MAAGVFLLTRMTPTTSILEAVIFMVIAGIGLGPFFSVLTIAAQNALPRTRLGIGTSAVRYLGQLGAVLGVAIVGTVVNNTLASDIASRLPASVANRLTPAGLKAATSPQVLVNPAYHATVVHTAQSAVAHVPPGPRHDQVAASVAAQAMQQAQHLLDQVFAALKLSLAVATPIGTKPMSIMTTRHVPPPSTHSVSCRPMSPMSGCPDRVDPHPQAEQNHLWSGMFPIRAILILRSATNRSTGSISNSHLQEHLDITPLPG